MTTSGTVDAAVLARQEDQQLTAIARITPGDSSKIRELINDPAIPSSLMSMFESAADEASYVQTLEKFNQQQQQKGIVQREQDQEKKEKEQRESWLNAMSPEYQQAYGQLMTTVGNADKEYNELRERLQQRGKALDDEAQEIDDKAIHLSDGNRAYVNSEGVLVDKNGVPLQGKEANEAKLISQQRNDSVASFGSYQQNQQSRADVERLAQRVDIEQASADKFGQDAKDQKIKDTDKIQGGNDDIQHKLADTKASALTVLNGDAVDSKADISSFSDLEGDSAPTTTSADRSSFASKVDGAGIKAISASTNFNAATQGANTATPTPSPVQKPSAPAAVTAPANS